MQSMTSFHKQISQIWNLATEKTLLLSLVTQNSAIGKIRKTKRAPKPTVAARSGIE